MNDRITAARQGRIDKSLTKRYTFDDGVTTLEAHIRRFTWHRKDSYVQEYGKKRHMETPKLKHPKTWYTIWRWRNGKETGIAVPKIVWDSLTDIPEAEYKPYFPPAPMSENDPWHWKEDDVCPVCGAPMDWMSDGFAGPTWWLACMDDETHTPRPYEPSIA